MLEITVEGIYESDIGSGQKKYQSFNYTFLTSRQTPKGIETHVMRRFVPLLVAKDKNKKSIPFSRLKSFIITDFKTVEDTKDCVIGKEIKTLNDWQIQDLAATLDLYEVPVFGSCSILELRNKAILAYMKKVLKIPMKNAKDKAELNFFKKQPDGTFTLDFSEEPPLIVEIPDGYFGNKKKEVVKKGLAYFMQKAGQVAANAVLTATGNQPIVNNDNSQKGQEGSSGGDGFPSAEELANGNGLQNNFISVNV